MDEVASNNEMSQAFSEDSNISPLVIKKAVMKDNNFALNLMFPKQQIDADHHPSSNIQILNEQQEDILDSSNSKKKKQMHRIDDIIKEEASSLY